MALSGRVCIVTGASRGIGKGIALQLGEAGATVYITGRTLTTKNGQQGSLELTAKEVKGQGGTCIPIVCDHTKDAEIKALFDRVEREQNGRLDILVNNAYAAVDFVSRQLNIPFWETDPAEHWDINNDVGLRNHFLCTTYASRLMVPRKSGLIVNISSGGGLGYAFCVGYGIGKQAVDRMAADCAIELRKHNVAMVSVWPGGVKTEKLLEHHTNPDTVFYEVSVAIEKGESPEYVGRSIVHLARDKNVMKKSGKILLTRDLGDEYGFLDIDGKQPYNFRSISNILEIFGWTTLSKFIPAWIKVPRWSLHMSSNKF